MVRYRHTKYSINEWVGVIQLGDSLQIEALIIDIIFMAKCMKNEKIKTPFTQPIPGIVHRNVPQVLE